MAVPWTSPIANRLLVVGNVSTLDAIPCGIILQGPPKLFHSQEEGRIVQILSKPRCPLAQYFHSWLWENFLTLWTWLGLQLASASDWKCCSEATYYCSEGRLTPVTSRKQKANDEKMKLELIYITTRSNFHSASAT